MPTDIAWTDETWNPTVGCTKAGGPGCDRCYAIGVAHRGLTPEHRGLTVRTDAGIDWTGEVRQLPERLAAPTRWRRPRRVFVDSMSDLFHPAVTDDFITQVFDVMGDVDRHTYQVLTKRPQRAAAWTWRYYDCDHGGSPSGDCGYCRPLPNVWLGTSIENDRFSWRARHIAAAKAAVRFVSAEPLLGPLPTLDLADVDWVIAGGESGRGARPVDLGWIRDLRDRCADHGVAFFVKQLGSAWGPSHGDPDTWPDDLRVRGWPAAVPVTPPA